MKSRYLNHPVDFEVEWPRKQTEFQFGQWQIVAFPPSKEFDPSLHIDLARARLNDIEGMSVLSQILSIATWLDDAYAVLLDGWSGNPVPCRPRRRTRCFKTSILDFWCNAWAPIEDLRAQRALAIYREAVNMEHFQSWPYAVLGYYKILETTLEGRSRGDYLERGLDRYLTEEKLDNYHAQLIGFDRQPTSKQLAKFIYIEGRQAIAHANMMPAINPDDALHQRKMSVAARVLQAIARRYIRIELHIGTSRWDQSDLG